MPRKPLDRRSGRLTFRTLLYNRNIEPADLRHPYVRHRRVELSLAGSPSTGRRLHTLFLQVPVIKKLNSTLNVMLTAVKLLKCGT